jgi:hypothetical protein
VLSERILNGCRLYDGPKFDADIGWVAPPCWLKIQLQQFFGCRWIEWQQVIGSQVSNGVNAFQKADQGWVAQNHWRKSKADRAWLALSLWLENFDNRRMGAANTLVLKLLALGHWASLHYWQSKIG